MSTVTDEIIAIETFVNGALPDVLTEKQTVPEQPRPNTLVIRFQNGDPPVKETPYYYRIDREYQFVYFSEFAEEAFPIMDSLVDAFEITESLPDTNMRIDGFTYGHPTLTDNKIYATIGILTAETRRSVPQKQYEKINNVYSRFT
ncbi:hypothetical protein M3231_15135 [Neobacillus mesonae]|nr:hypothetical protein [Neobacillus mesonae]